MMALKRINVRSKGGKKKRNIRTSLLLFLPSQFHIHDYAGCLNFSAATRAGLCVQPSIRLLTSLERCWGPAALFAAGAAGRLMLMAMRITEKKTLNGLAAALTEKQRGSREIALFACLCHVP